MAVNAIGADIQRPIFEPADIDVAGGKAGVLDLRIRFDPIDPLAMFAPKRLGIAD